MEQTLPETAEVAVDHADTYWVSTGCCIEETRSEAAQAVCRSRTVSFS